MSRLYRPLLEPLGLTYPQYLVMLSLWDKDAKTVGELGSTIGLESNTLTPLLKRMAEAGLVDRVKNSQDERVTRIHLTSKGRELQANASSVQACILDASGLAPDAVAALRDQILDLEAQIKASLAKS